MSDPRRPLERLRDAQNARDLDAFVECFREDYESVQPLHPGRGFGGREQVRQNWGAIFAAVPDFRSELVRSAVERNEVWTERHGTGTRADGSALDMRGVIIAGIRDDRITWGRLYVANVEPGDETIDEAVDRMARGPGQARR